MWRRSCGSIRRGSGRRDGIGVMRIRGIIRGINRIIGRRVAGGEGRSRSVGSLVRIDGIGIRVRGELLYVFDAGLDGLLGLG